MARFPGGLTTLHLAGDKAIKWLGMQCKRSEEEEDLQPGVLGCNGDFYEVPQI